MQAVGERPQGLAADPADPFWAQEDHSGLDNFLAHLFHEPQVDLAASLVPQALASRCGRRPRAVVAVQRGPAGRAGTGGAPRSRGGADRPTVAAARPPPLSVSLPLHGPACSLPVRTSRAAVADSPAATPP